MSVDQKEIKRITKLQKGKNCHSCKIGTYVKWGIVLLCDNCGKEPFKK